MRLICLLPMAALAACQPGAPSPPSNAIAEEIGLQAGMYDVSTTETLPGIGTAPEEREGQCIRGEQAAHPESFLARVHGGLAGCTAGDVSVSGHESRGELRCVDNHTLGLSATYTRDSWDQTISGVSDDGSYEAHQTAHLVGTC